MKFSPGCFIKLTYEITDCSTGYFPNDRFLIIKSEFQHDYCSVVSLRTGEGLLFSYSWLSNRCVIDENQKW